MSAIAANSAELKCVADPIPALPYLISPGFAFAISMTSWTDLIFEFFGTTSTIGLVATSAIGSKSLMGS